ncbi:CapA family protein [Telmatobacter sp. DSM 110680]|uniref:CapA family protein n=1 Tax=Telmatobacter sp. DSM 110680 TaxID=3036704 RepID=A0AAU7DCG2_9BACT
MDHTTRWLKSGGEGFPPSSDSEPGNWLGLSPQAAALAVIILLGLAATATYFVGLPAFLNQAAAPAPYPHELAKVTFAIGGDVIPHEPVRAAAAAAGGGAEGWGALLGDVNDVFEGVDFGFVNMETPVAPDHSKGSKPFMFDAPVALPQALKANGIKIVSFANNHVMDQGWAGFAETRDHLREVGLQFVGSGDTAAQTWQPLIVEANGIKVGWLGMTRWLNGNRNPDKDDQPHVNFFPYPGESGGAQGADEAKVLDAVKAAKAQCDLLVISVHWGTEYATAPRPEDVDMAHKMLNAGASVIVGHHPHVLQPIETYATTDGRMTVIFYSLGNFLSNQSRNYVDGLMPDKDGDPRDSMIGLFSVVRNDFGPGGMRVEVEHVGMMPVWGENNRNALAAGKAKTPNIHPALIDREIPKAQAKLDELNKAAQDGAELNAAQKQEFVEATNRLKVLTDRRAQILARTGDEYVIEPPKVAAKP